MRPRTKSARQRLTIAAIVSAMTLGFAPIAITPALAQASSNEVAKDGSCPKGFSASGSRCVSSDMVALPRLGSCPTGFKASGKYCVGDDDEYAEVRDGSCPSGLKTSGKYCIK